MKFLQRYAFHPIVLAIYPVLALLAHNIHEVEVSVAIRSLVLSLVLAILLMGILQLILKNWLRAALVASLVLILFFSFGQVYNFLKGQPVLGMHLGRYRLLTPVYLVLLGCGSWWALSRKRNLPQVTLILNIVAIFLWIMPILQMGSYFTQKMIVRTRLQAHPDATGGITATAAQVKPDIYYIILDSYSRADVLQQDYGFDNSYFVDGLRKMGFYVADCSQTNYPSTEVSLSSSLNMTYLQEIVKTLPPGTNLHSTMSDLLIHNLVRKQFEAFGYKTVAFATGYAWIEWKDASMYLEPEFNLLSLKEMRPFEAMFIKSTAAVALFDIQALFPQGPQEIDNISYQDHIKRETFLLNRLEDLPSIPGAKFIYAHILIPHGPFVFEADGKTVPDPQKFEGGDEKTWKQGYVNEVQFINGRLLSILPGIIADSSVPPVIIIQGDHGSKVNRFPILNAYYLPGEAKTRLYPTISPVNSFRLIFDAYFGAHYKLLDDTPYATIDLTKGEFSTPKKDEILDCPGK